MNPIITNPNAIGTTSALVEVPLSIKRLKRNPTVNDAAEVGQMAINILTGALFICAQITAGQYIWNIIGTESSSGNLIVSGNLTVDGTSTLTGNTAIDNNLNVTGISTLTGAVTTGSTLGVGTNLTVTGTSTLNNSVTCNSSLTANGVITTDTVFSCNTTLGSSPTSVFEIGVTPFLKVNQLGGYTLGLGVSGNTGATAFLGSVAGITTAVNDAVPVLISASTGQLGTVSSSARYKDNIKDLKDYSSVVELLRPVSFTYKSNNASSIGLIAEEVEQLTPELVIYKNEMPETVKYQDLPIILLQYVQKLNERVETLEAMIKR